MQIASSPWRKKNTLAARRRADAIMMVRYNHLTSKENRQVKENNLSSYNDDRLVIRTLFDDLGPRFENRAGGYTRILRLGARRGDNSLCCYIEYLSD